MTPADGATRRQAWLVTLLLGAALALAASFGVNHQYDTTRVRHTQCIRTCNGPDPVRPDAVWVFGALAAALLIGTGAVGVRGRSQSVELVLGSVEAVAQ
jgi:hypothetical protein